MGLFSFLLKQNSNKPSSLSNQEIVEIAYSIGSCNSISSLNNLYKKYINYNHPSIFHQLGVRYFLMHERNTAKEIFIQGAMTGSSHPCPYYDSLFIDSIGQCITMLLTQYNCGKSSSVRKFTALAYVFLSRCIDLYPIQAYDSYRSRAILLHDHENKDVVENLVVDYLGLNASIDQLIVSDFYHSATLPTTQHHDDIYTAYNILENMTFFGTKLNYSMDNVVDYGKKHHQQLFKKLEERFKKNKFDITRNDFISI